MFKRNTSGLFVVPDTQKGERESIGKKSRGVENVWPYLGLDGSEEVILVNKAEETGTHNVPATLLSSVNKKFPENAFFPIPEEESATRKTRKDSSLVKGL